MEVSRIITDVASQNMTIQRRKTREESEQPIILEFNFNPKESMDSKVVKTVVTLVSSTLSRSISQQDQLAKGSNFDKEA